MVVVFLANTEEILNLEIKKFLQMMGIEHETLGTAVGPIKRLTDGLFKTDT